MVGVWQLGLVLTPPPQAPRLCSRSLFWVQRLQILLPLRRGSCQGVFRSEMRTPVSLCVCPDCRHPLPVSPRPLSSETALSVSAPQSSGGLVKLAFLGPFLRDLDALGLGRGGELAF